MLGDELLYYLAGGLDDEERRVTLAAVARSRNEQRDAARRRGPLPAADAGGTVRGGGGDAQVSPGRGHMRPARPDGHSPAGAGRRYTPMTLTDDELRAAAERPWAG